MAETLERDKRSRAAHRAQIRRITREAKELQNVLDQKKPEHRQKWKHYKSTLEKRCDILSELDKAILLVIKEEESKQKSKKHWSIWIQSI